MDGAAGREPRRLTLPPVCGWTRRRRRAAFQVGCLPMAILAALSAVALVNLVTYRYVPSWVSDPLSYMLGGRLAVTLGTLAVIQLLATWYLGLHASVVGAAAVPGPGISPRPRLKAARRRARVAAWAVLLLRLMLLGVGLLGGLLVFSGWLGVRLPSQTATQVARTFAVRPALLVAAGLLGLIQLVAGPFLRLRYSAALGALASALTGECDQRIWAAVSARLGAGLAGALTVIWGGAAGVLFLLVSYDPFYASRYRPVPNPFPFVPDYMSRVLTVAGIAGAGLAVYLAGQALLPLLYTWLAGRILAWRAAARRARPPAPVRAPDSPV